MKIKKSWARVIRNKIKFEKIMYLTWFLSFSNLVNFRLSRLVKFDYFKKWNFPKGSKIWMQYAWTSNILSLKIKLKIYSQKAFKFESSLLSNAFLKTIEFYSKSDQIVRKIFLICTYKTFIIFVCGLFKSFLFKYFLLLLFTQLLAYL